MKLTNLVNFDKVQTLEIKLYIDISYISVISNNYEEDDNAEGFIQPNLYDTSKEYKAYLDLIK